MKALFLILGLAAIAAGGILLANSQIWGAALLFVGIYLIG